MIEFKKETKKVTVNIANAEAEITLRSVTKLDKDAYTVKLLDIKANLTERQQEAKVNVEELVKEKLYLLAWVVQDINVEERWKTWDMEARMEWLQEWLAANENEFLKAVELVEKEAGKLLEI